VRMYRVHFYGHRSLNPQEFEVGSFTVLFGKNNAGKTNLLEGIYVMLSEDEPGGGEARVRVEPGYPTGAIFIELEHGLAFDDAVLAEFPDWEPVEDGFARFSELPPGHACYAITDRCKPELWFTDVREFGDEPDKGFPGIRLDTEDECWQVDEQSRSDRGPYPRPLFLGWEFGDVDQWATTAIAAMTAFTIPYPVWMRAIEAGSNELFPSGQRFLEPADEDDPAKGWRLRVEVQDRLDQLATLATDLLPDFLDGTFLAEFLLPTQWEDSPRVRLRFRERGDSAPHSLGDFGRGASRWLGIAVQVALRIMDGDPKTKTLGIMGDKAFSGHVLLVDEPEAHLHPSAVASIVRWCQRMVSCGFNVMAASHHEEFLRASSEEVTFVKVSRHDEAWSPGSGDDWTRSFTKARALLSLTTSALQELADEIGMHPAAALSLHRAILFVEGPLDEAVLDEYAGHALDAAGVTIIPIHGTKNLEGLIDGEFTTRLGIKTGVLTDNTHTGTIWDRSNTKRSGEEIKLVRLIQRFEDRGLLPPTPFGVPEDDLLFALPPVAIREFLGGPFPGWRELREECRATEGRGPSDSVDWKSYALKRYGLPITTAAGVRRIVRALDLAGVELTSIQNVVNEVIDWAK
jgi:energy-coupling factor transporter ATP-binding protein EcfA2